MENVIFKFIVCSEYKKGFAFNVVITMIFCVLYAISDEIHQLFSLADQVK